MNNRWAYGKYKFKAIFLICFLLIGNYVSSAQILVQAETESCIHINAKIENDEKTVYSKDPDRYCLSHVKYEYWTCPDCRARWTVTDIEYTQQHNWIKILHNQQKDYSKSTDIICYRVVEVESLKCSNCGITKENKFISDKIFHFFKEKIGESDLIYTYYYNVCIECGYRIFSRKSKEPYEDILHKNRPVIQEQ